MVIEIYISSLILYLIIASYNFKQNVALKYWGRKINGLPSEEEEINEVIDSGQTRAYAESFVGTKNIKSDTSRMNPITPKITVFLSYFYFTVFICIFILGFSIFQWYFNIPITIGIWFLSIKISRFYPKANSQFWYNRFYNSLAIRRKYYLWKSNFIKVSACEYFIDRFRENQNT